MRTEEIKFKIKENILHSLNQSKDEFTKQSRLYTALYLFKTHKLSFGQAADLADLTRENFLNELNKHKIDFIDYNPDELEDELERFSS